MTDPKQMPAETPSSTAALGMALPFRALEEPLLDQKKPERRVQNIDHRHPFPPARFLRVSSLWGNYERVYYLILQGGHQPPGLR